MRAALRMTSSSSSSLTARSRTITPLAGTSSMPSGAQLLTRGDGDVIGLEGDRRLRQLAQAAPDVAHERPLRRNDLHTVHRTGRLHVAPVGEKNHAVATDGEGRVRAFEACEPADVDRVRDEEAGSPDAVERAEEPLDAMRHEACASQSSASL